MRAAMAVQLRSTGHTTGLKSPREARVFSRQCQRFRHANLASGHPHEYPELVVAALDLASALEERLAEAEFRLSELTQNVEFLEEFRELFRARDLSCAPGVLRPPATPKPATARPASHFVSQEAFSQSTALEARLSWLEAELEKTLKGQLEYTTAAQLEDFSKQLSVQEANLREIERKVGSVRTWPAESEKPQAQLDMQTQPDIERRQADMEMQFDEFGRALRMLVGDVQVLSAQTEWRLGALEAGPQAFGGGPQAGPFGNLSGPWAEPRVR